MVSFRFSSHCCVVVAHFLRRAFFHKIFPIASVVVLSALLCPTSNPIFAQTLTTMASFNGSNGEGPGNLMLVGNTLYGTTVYGGNLSINNGLGWGALFSLPMSGGNPTVLVSFNGSNGGSPNSLTLVGNTLYGTCYNGGNLSLNGGHGDGTVFSLPLSGGNPSVLASFNDSNGQPNSGVVVSGNTLYDTTITGGVNNDGTVFSVSLSGGSLNTLVSLNGSNGGNPLAGLTLVGNTLYGTTENYGANGYGTVFSLPLSGGNPTVLTSPNGGNGAAYPNGRVTLIGNTLYGTTYAGGVYGNGTIFSLPLSGGDSAVLVSFNGRNGISYPNDGLTLVGNTLYGTVTNGGANGDGMVFSVPLSGGSPTVLFSFDGNNGLAPNGGLIVSGNTLYGTTAGGGANNDGTVFALSLAPSSVAWAKPVSENWSAASNWTPANAPTSTISASFNTGSTSPYTVTLTGASAANNLAVQGDNVALNTAGNTLAVSGALTIGPGTGGTRGSLTVYADANGHGGMSVAQGLTIAAGGQLSGNASIAGDVSNSGTVLPGGANPGTLSIAGDYIQQATGSLTIRINGPAASGSFDSLSVSGNGSLAGRLALTTPGTRSNPGFLPSFSDTYAVLSAGASVSGKFNSGSGVVATQFADGSTSGVFNLNYSGGQATLSDFHQVHLLSFGVDFPNYPDPQAGQTDTGLKGGVTATTVYNAFQNVVGFVNGIPDPVSAVQTTNLSSLHTDISTIAGNVYPGDLCVFYLGSHGSFNPSGAEQPLTRDTLAADNVTRTTTTTTGPSLFVFSSNGGTNSTLDPQTLTSWFDTPQWNNVNKLFIVDSCYSSGFWSGPNGAPAYMSALPHSAMIWSAPESTFAYYNTNNGELFLGIALAQVLDGQGSQQAVTDFQNGPLSFQTLLEDLQSTVEFDITNGSGFTNGFLADGFFQSGLLPTQDGIGGFATSDFSLDLGGPRNAVPEPAPILLLMVGATAILGKHCASRFTTERCRKASLV